MRLVIFRDLWLAQPDGAKPDGAKTVRPSRTFELDRSLWTAVFSHISRPSPFRFYRLQRWRRSSHSEAYGNGSRRQGYLPVFGTSKAELLARGAGVVGRSACGRRLPNRGAGKKLGFVEY